MPGLTGSRFSITSLYPPPIPTKGTATKNLPIFKLVTERDSLL